MDDFGSGQFVAEEDVKNVVLDIIKKMTEVRKYTDPSKVFDTVDTSLVNFEEKDIFDSLVRLKYIQLLELMRNRSMDSARYMYIQMKYTSLEQKLSEHLSRGKKGKMFDFLQTQTQEIVQHEEEKSGGGILSFFRRG